MAEPFYRNVWKQVEIFRLHVVMYGINIKDHPGSAISILVRFSYTAIWDHVNMMKVLEKKNIQPPVIFSSQEQMQWTTTTKRWSKSNKLHINL